MKRPFDIHVTGPLATYAAGLLDDLASRGYSPWSATAYLALLAQLSRWLSEHTLEPDELTDEKVDRFVVARRVRGYAKGQSARGMVRVLTDHLRNRGVIPAGGSPVVETPAEQLLAEFGEYLVTERGLSRVTIVGYLRHASKLLAFIGVTGTSAAPGLGGLTASAAAAFMLTESRSRKPGAMNDMAVGLRALMRFLYVRGHTPRSLASAIVGAPVWRDGGLSRALGDGQVALLLGSCDRETAAGQRDYAILSVLARLGLRANEIASMEVRHVDWRNGEILVLGKGNRRDRLPLPVDVGEAIASYCHDARPRVTARALFLHLRAPYTALSSTAVSHVVVRACQRAGLPRAGAHRLRHTMATDMRRAGAPLFEIGQVLRHRHAATTAHYAKEDMAGLALVARRWPGAAT